MLEMEVLPPIILPGGGRFKTSPGSLSGVLVSIRHQSATSGTEVIRWRFSMNQSGRQNAGNGPTIEGRVPARPDTPFEECYQFVSGKMGYRRGSWANAQFNLELGIPGIYNVFAWIERNGAPISATQNCTFEIVHSDVSAPSVSLGC